MSNTLNGSLTPRSNLIGSLSSGGGSGGTSNYNDLSNKPSINGVTLSGNKTTDDLNLPNELSELDDVNINHLVGGNLYCLCLNYVNTPISPNDNKWEPFLLPLVVNINNIGGVVIETPSNDDLLVYRDGYFYNNKISLGSLNNIQLASVQNGDVLAYDSNTSKWVNKKLYTDYEATLTAGNTTVTISNAAITGNETIDVYTNVFGVNPTDIVASSGSIVLTFPVQASDVSVKVRLS